MEYPFTFKLIKVNMTTQQNQAIIWEWNDLRYKFQHVVKNDTDWIIIISTL